MIQGICFDLGGTLLNTQNYCGQLNHILQKEIGLSWEELHPFYKKFFWTRQGDKAAILNDFCRETHYPNEKTLLEKLYRTCFRTVLYPDVLPVIERLSQFFQLGIIANTTVWTSLSLDELGISSRFFAYKFYSHEQGIAKPDVEVFHRVSKQMNLPASQLLFVGDSVTYDIEPALKAGWSALLIIRNASKSQFPYKHVHSLEELIPLTREVVHDTADQ